MYKIHITNFQSIVDLELKVEGLTVVTAPSHSGKSAIVRATDALLTSNWFQDAYQRKGTSQTTIQLTRDTDVLEFVRKGTATSYTINGNSFGKLGCKAPVELGQLGYGEVQIAESASEITTITPQIQNQFDGPYQDIIKASALTQLLGSFTNLAPYQTAQDRAKKQQGDARREAERIQREVNKASTIVATLESFQPAVYQSQLDTLAQMLAYTDTSLSNLTTIVGRLKTIQSLTYVKMMPAPFTVQKLTCATKLVSVSDTLVNHLPAITQTHGAAVGLHKVKKKLQKSLPSTIMTSSSLSKVLLNSAESSQIATKFAAALSALTGTHEKLSPVKVAPVKTFVLILETFQTWATSMSQSLVRFNALHALKQQLMLPASTMATKLVNETTQLQTTADYSVQVLDQLKTLTENYSDMQGNLQGLVQQREALASAIENNQCPLCFSVLCEHATEPKKKKVTKKATKV